jgi:mannobiose 2-epimerase
MLNKQEVEIMARENILPFWQKMADEQYGGFYGEADFFGKINKTSDKGGVLASRILWTFSAAYSLFKDENYKASAAHARDFLFNAFFDKEHGGVYWLVDNTGKPLQTRKQFYNIAFSVYAFSEHYLAFGDQTSQDMAIALFDVLEKYGYDPVQGGYIEARIRDWQNIDDFRLSGKDLNSPKSMNTNLHVLEAYTVLTRALLEGSDNQKRVKNALENLLRLTLTKIVNKNWHFELFFDMNWNSLSKEVSWGHDIEGSWLMYEAALAVGDENLINEVKNAAVAIANVIHAKALDYKNGNLENGGLLSGVNDEGQILTKKEWWPQAEAVVGFYNAYELSGEKKYLDAANGIWEYIKNHFADNTNGEWHNELDADNKPDTKMPKAGFWKCPYHNARACFEIIKRMN